MLLNEQVTGKAAQQQVAATTASTGAGAGGSASAAAFAKECVASGLFAQLWRRVYQQQLDTLSRVRARTPASAANAPPGIWKVININRISIKYDFNILCIIWFWFPVVTPRATSYLDSVVRPATGRPGTARPRTSGVPRQSQFPVDLELWRYLSPHGLQSALQLGTTIFARVRSYLWVFNYTFLLVQYGSSRWFPDHFPQRVC